MSAFATNGAIVLPFPERATAARRSRRWKMAAALALALAALLGAVSRPVNAGDLDRAGASSLLPD